MRLLLLTGLILAAGASAAADTYVVHPDGTGDFPTIQAAINAASDADTVALASGVFTGEGNRDIAFNGRRIVLRGLSGADSCIIDCQGTEAEHHRGFSFTGADSGGVIEDLQVRNGYHQLGGAVRCSDGGVILRRCVFRENTAVSRGGAFGTGSRSASTFQDCRFSLNTAGDDGGAVSAVIDTLVLEGCTFSNNHADGAGGAIHFGDDILASLVACRFLSNEGEAGGGGVYIYGPASMAVLEGCEFIENWSATCTGGGIQTANLARVEVRDCTIVRNYGNRGGGILPRVRLSETESSSKLRGTPQVS